MHYNFVSATILLLLIMDPFGNIPYFASALKPVAPERRNFVIVRECLIAFGLLLAFMFFGNGFLAAMNLSEMSLQMTGGMVLFLIALRMVFPPPAQESTEPQSEPLIVPLAVPGLAGPSALATVLLLVSQEPDRRWEWVGALCIAVAACAVVLLLSEFLQRLVGPRVLEAVERLMGLILVAAAVEMMMRAITMLAHQLGAG